MPRRRIGAWSGGYVAQSHGRKVYVIRRTVGGRDFEISTRASSERAALQQLERFEADPQRYDPAGDPDEAPLLLTAELGFAFLKWSRDEKGNSHEWVKDQTRYLTWWTRHLRGVDLRRLHIARQIDPLLAGAAARRQRIEVLKAFCGWLVKKRYLQADPTAGALTVPQARPEQQERRKDVAGDVLERTCRKLPFAWRDPLDVQLGTGWHVREVARFSREGLVDLVQDLARPDVAGELVVRRKSGDVKRTAVGAYVLAAALRLRDRGGLSVSRYATAVRRAAAAAGVAIWGPGQVRHTVATFARARAGTAAAADFLDHASERTTKRFYAQHAAPPKVPTPR